MKDNSMLSGMNSSILLIEKTQMSLASNSSKCFSKSNSLMSATKRSSTCRWNARRRILKSKSLLA